MTHSKHKILALISAISLVGSIQAAAATEITVLNSKGAPHRLAPPSKIIEAIKQRFDIEQYSQVKMQIIYNQKHQPDHVIVYLVSKLYHSVQTAVINLDANENPIATNNQYQLTTDDFAAQPGITVAQAACPDPNVEFIVFAPNKDKLEQKISIEVAESAEAHGLKTIRLLRQDATRDNYLNYMKCPKLKGNFYNGDADPWLIDTVDGVIASEDFNTILANQFQYKVTNIWLACQAYVDPMKTSMLVNTQSQKYAAGINNLEVGPSDKTAACAMEAALDNKPMTASFEDCYKKLDTKKDLWGFSGDGSDYFGA